MTMKPREKLLNEMRLEMHGPSLRDHAILQNEELNFSITDNDGDTSQDTFIIEITPAPVEESTVEIVLENEEVISFTHNAESRDIFAYGAIEAALWLLKQDPGYYELENVN